MNISYSTIGRNIKTARKNVQLTQEQAAEKLGISTLHFGRIERGQRPVSLHLLSRIADVLNVRMETLLSGCIIDVERCSALTSCDPQSAAYVEYALTLVDQFREQIQSCLEALEKEAKN